MSVSLSVFVHERIIRKEISTKPEKRLNSVLRIGPREKKKKESSDCLYVSLIRIIITYKRNERDSNSYRRLRY